MRPTHSLKLRGLNTFCVGDYFSNSLEAWKREERGYADLEHARSLEATHSTTPGRDPTVERTVACSVEQDVFSGGGDRGTVTWRLLLHLRSNSAVTSSSV